MAPVVNENLVIPDNRFKDIAFASTLSSSTGSSGTSNVWFKINSSKYLLLIVVTGLFEMY